MGIFEIQKGRRNLNMKIYHAQVNHLENPVGFRMERTVFSWKIKEAKGKQQSYARIRVSSDEAMEHLLFDSGEDTKASSLCYPDETGAGAENTVLLDGGSRQRCRRKSSKRSAVF